jgi:phage baseplate assembly protein W
VAKTLTQNFKDLNLGFKKHPVTDDLMVTKDEAAIKQAIVSLLLTERGERLFQPELGGGLRRFLFEPLDYGTAALIQSAIRDVLQRYEPRIRIESLNAFPNQDEDGFDIELTFNIIGTEFAPIQVEFFLTRTR